MKRLLTLILTVLFASQCLKAEGYYYNIRVGQQKYLKVNPSSFLHPYITKYVWDAPSVGLYIVSGGWIHDDWCVVEGNVPSNLGDRYEVSCRIYERAPGSVVERVTQTVYFYITVEGISNGNGEGVDDGQLHPCTGGESPFVLDVFYTYPAEGDTIPPTDLIISFGCNNDLRTKVYNPYSFMYMEDENGKKYYPKSTVHAAYKNADESVYTIYKEINFKEPFEENMGYTYVIPVKSLFNSDSQYNSNEFRFSFRTGFASAIREVESKKLYDVYDLEGRLLRKHASSTDGLPRGVYIINKKKVIIK